MLDNLYYKHCLEFMKTLPSNSIQFIMADPPYLISDKKDDGFKKKKTNLSTYKLVQASWDIKTNENKKLIFECISEFKRILKRGGSMIIWYDVWKMSYLKEELESHKLKQIRMCEWLKTNCPPIASSTGYLPNSKEYFIYAAKNVSYKKEWTTAVFNSEYDKGVYSHSITGKNRTHTHEKPYKLMEEIILKHTNIGDLVYIPFAGSGVDIEVCINNDRQWLATENDIESFNNIVKRIS